MQRGTIVGIFCLLRTKKKGICGRMEEGKKEERQTGAVMEDRGGHSKKINIK